MIKRKRSPQRLIRVFSPDKATYKKDVGNFKTPPSREFYQASCEMHGPSQSKLLGYENGRFLNVIIHWNKAAKKDITKLKTKLFFGVSIFFVAVLLLTPLALAD